MKPTKQSLIRRLSNHRNRLARFYDNAETADRFTASYLAVQSNYGGQRWFWYRGMSVHPSDPQGFGCSGESKGVPVDFPPAPLGRKNHLGRRIRFQDLPEDCQRLVLQDLMD